MTITRSGVVIACVCGCSLWLQPPAASGQSLAEIARLEAARRKVVPAAPRVFTNDDLGPVPPPPAVPAARSASETATPDGSPAASPEAPGAVAGAAGAGPAAPQEPKQKDEAYWHGRIEGERNALARARTLVDALQSRINALSADFTSRDDPAQRDVVAANRQTALVELDRMKQEVQQHTKAIAEIQEEARRAGAPAGWVR